MNNTYYNLDVPKEKIVKSVMYKFTITNINLTLFNSVNMSVMLYDENDKIVDGQYFCMSGQDYNDWGNSDEYLINWVKIQIASLNLNIE